MFQMTGRKIVIGLLSLMVLLGAGLCAAVLAVGLMLSSPKPIVIGPPPASLPDTEIVEISSKSGSALHGWWVPGKVPGGGAVVLLHGVWENRLRMFSRAVVLHRNGFSVLLVDLQAHGESPGRRITFGKNEGLDAAATVQFVRDRLPGEQIGVIGVSLGGAAALLGPKPLDVQALVLESVYPDIDAALANRLRTALGPVAGPLLTPILSPLFERLLPPILGVEPAELRPIDRIGSATASILLLSGTEDDRTPLTEAHALFDAAPQPKRFVAVLGAAHVDLERFDRDGYWKEVLPFLNGTLHRQLPKPQNAVPRSGVRISEPD